MVLVSTSDIGLAGTNANVFIKLFGTQYESIEKQLKNSGTNSFGRGRYENFTLHDFEMLIHPYLIA